MEFLFLLTLHFQPVFLLLFFSHTAVFGDLRHRRPHNGVSTGPGTGCDFTGPDRQQMWTDSNQAHPYPVERTTPAAAT